MWRIIFGLVVVLAVVGGAFFAGFVFGSTMTPLTETASAMATSEGVGVHA